MRLGMSGAAYYGRYETEDAAALLPALPLDTCEIFLETPSEYCAGFGRIVREKLGALPCTTVHPLGTQFEAQLFGRSPRQVEDAFRLFTGVCEAGQAIGAQYYVFHGPFGVHAPLSPERIYRLPQTFARMQDIAHRCGLTVLWENVHWCALRTPKEVATAMQLLPEIRFVLDVKQSHRAGVDPFDMLTAMGSRVRHLHVMDIAADGALCLPGAGTLNFPRLMGQLRHQGFDGAIILEPYAEQARDDAALRAALAHLRQAM